MKKYLRVFLIAVMCLTLIGCGGSDNNENNNNNGNNTGKDNTNNPVNMKTYKATGYEDLTDRLSGANDAFTSIGYAIVVYFENGQAVNAKYTLTFQTAGEIAPWRDALEANSSYKDFKVDGKVMTYDYTEGGFQEFEGKSKNEVKTILETKENIKFQ